MGKASRRKRAKKAGAPEALTQTPTHPPVRKRSNRPKGRRPEPARHRVRRRLLKIGGFFLGVIAFVGSYASIVGFILPRVSVEPIAASDPKDPYTFSFRIHNNGSLDLIHVFYVCKVRGAWIDGTEYPIRLVADDNSWMEMAPVVQGEIYRTITPNETDNFSCHLFTEPFPFMLEDKRQMAIVVNYRPAYYPFTVEKQFTFSLKKSTDGAYQWLPIANERQ